MTEKDILRQGKVFFEAGGYQLAGSFWRRQEKCVVFVHGLQSSRESQKAMTLSGICEGLNLSFFAFDFSGCGESEGLFAKTTLSGRIRELSEALVWLKGEKMREYVLVGSSFGALVALYCADREDVLASVFIACPVFWQELSFSRSVVDGMEVSSRFFEDIRNYYPLEQAKKIRRGLVIHGSQDRVVPLKNSQALYEALLKPKNFVTIQGGDHRLSQAEHREMCMREVVAWIKRWG